MSKTACPGPPSCNFGELNTQEYIYMHIEMLIPMGVQTFHKY